MAIQGGNITGPNTQSLPVLLIESAATARHTINKLLVAGGFRIALANGYADGLTKLHNFTKQQGIGAVVVGFSASYSHDEAELLNQLKQSELQDVPVLILCHEVKRELFEWVARRGIAARVLIAYNDYKKTKGSPPSRLSPPTVPCAYSSWMTHVRHNSNFAAY